MADHGEINRLRLRVAELEAQLAEAHDDARRYREGLERAVNELNARQQQARGAREREFERLAAAQPGPRTAAPRVSTVSAPEVQLLGDMVLVTGRLWNSGDEDYRGWLAIELLHDGEMIDSARQALDLPARTDLAYSESFRILTGTTGTYSARVRIE